MQVNIEEIAHLRSSAIFAEAQGFYNTARAMSDIANELEQQFESPSRVCLAAANDPVRLNKAA